ncbi:MAG: hypothetical protein C0618_03680 [Desulfuromonas sp.]|nr:MAG: hypothetical protein C0618_03680 [Desulfuromonas sp.]
MKKTVWALALSLCLCLLHGPANSLAQNEKLENCTVCHNVAERYANVPKMGHLKCTGCHMGDGTATEAQLAHSGMYPDPTDFTVIDLTCGACHPKIVASARTM